MPVPPILPKLKSFFQWIRRHPLWSTFVLLGSLFVKPAWEEYIGTKAVENVLQDFHPVDSTWSFLAETVRQKVTIPAWALGVLPLAFVLITFYVLFKWRTNSHGGTRRLGLGDTELLKILTRCPKNWEFSYENLHNALGREKERLRFHLDNLEYAQLITYTVGVSSTPGFTTYTKIELTKKGRAECVRRSLI